MKMYRVKICSCGMVIDLPNADDILCQRCGKLYNRMGREVTSKTAKIIKDAKPRVEVIFR